MLYVCFDASQAVAECTIWPLMEQFHYLNVSLTSQCTANRVVTDWNASAGHRCIVRPIEITSCVPDRLLTPHSVIAFIAARVRTIVPAVT